MGARPRSKPATPAMCGDPRSAGRGASGYRPLGPAQPSRSSTGWCPRPPHRPRTSPRAVTPNGCAGAGSIAACGPRAPPETLGRGAGHRLGGSDGRARRSPGTGCSDHDGGVRVSARSSRPRSCLRSPRPRAPGPRRGGRPPRQGRPPRDRSQPAPRCRWRTRCRPGTSRSSPREGGWAPILRGQPPNRPRPRPLRRRASSPRACPASRGATRAPAVGGAAA